MLERLVNLIPQSLSGEANQDSEPNLAVNPANTDHMVATAFTPDPLHGPNAPIYVSTDGGQSWSLRTVIPGNGPVGTGDISVGFATTSGVLYVGILSANAPAKRTRLQILRTVNYLSPAIMPVLVDRLDVDQPWVVAATMQTGAKSGQDVLYVGDNDLAEPRGHSATVDLSFDAAVPTPGFNLRRIERRATLGQDGPPVRLSMHADGTVYAVHQRWTAAQGNTITLDIVVTRDDAFADGPNPFTTLQDAADRDIGQRVVTGRTIVWNAVLAQERLGADAAISVDPTNSDVVYIAWGDGEGHGAHPWTIHVRRSDDRGQTWSNDLRTIKSAKNPCLAVNSQGAVGFLYQQVVGRGAHKRWATFFEVSTDMLEGAPTPTKLHSALAAQPVAAFWPYLGDYARLLSVDGDFHGVFAGSNHADKANFPNEVAYQRNVDWEHHTLLDLDGATPVPDSIDPFYFRWTP